MDTKPACLQCGANDWTIETAMLGLIQSEVRKECEVTKCAHCGFYYMTDEQIDAAYKELTNGTSKL